MHISILEQKKNTSSPYHFVFLQVEIEMLPCITPVCLLFLVRISNLSPHLCCLYYTFESTSEPKFTRTIEGQRSRRLRAKRHPRFVCCDASYIFRVYINHLFLFGGVIGGQSEGRGTRGWFALVQYIQGCHLDSSHASPLTAANERYIGWATARITILAPFSY